MKDLIKNYLGIAGIALMLVVGYAAISYVGSYSESVDPPQARSFSVMGESKMAVIPDIAKFNFEVIVEGGRDLGTLQEEVSIKNNEAIDFLKSSGVGEEDIRTASYRVSPRYQYFSCPRDGGPCPPAEIVGYTVKQSVAVKVRDLTEVGQLLSGVVNRGANSVSALSFDVDDRESLKMEIREKAIEEAKEKAKAVARAAGFRIGKLISIEDDGGFRPYPEYALGMGELEDSLRSSMSAPDVRVEPGSEEIIVRVYMRYEIR